MGGEKSTKLIKGCKRNLPFYLPFWELTNPLVQFGIFESMILYFLQPGGICHPFFETHVVSMLFLFAFFMSYSLET